MRASAPGPSPWRIDTSLCPHCLCVQTPPFYKDTSQNELDPPPRQQPHCALAMVMKAPCPRKVTLKDLGVRTPAYDLGDTVQPVTPSSVASLALALCIYPTEKTPSFPRTRLSGFVRGNGTPRLVLPRASGSVEFPVAAATRP